MITHSPQRIGQALCIPWKECFDLLERPGIPTPMTLFGSLFFLFIPDENNEVNVFCLFVVLNATSSASSETVGRVAPLLLALSLVYS